MMISDNDDLNLQQKQHLLDIVSVKLILERLSIDVIQMKRPPTKHTGGKTLGSKVLEPVTRCRSRA